MQIFRMKPVEGENMAAAENLALRRAASLLAGPQTTAFAHTINPSHIKPLSFAISFVLCISKANLTLVEV